MEDFKKVIGNNIAKLRKNYGLTQLDFAEKLNYSDKSVSKWERGEALPDILVLKQISKYFNISLDALTSEHKSERSLLNKSKKYKNRNRLLIALVSAVGVWVISTIIFAVLNWLPIEIPNKWLTFIWGFDVSLFVLMIFSCVWGKRIWTEILVSLVVWFFAICLYFSIDIPSKWLLFIICIPVQISIILAFFIAKRKRNLKEEAKSEIGEV